MRKAIRTTTFFLILLAMGVSSAVAQTPMSCEPARGEAIIDANNVRAKILNNGALFWNGGRAIHEVPKGSGLNTQFKATVLFGGIVGGDVRTAAARSGNWEFWPGPYDEVAAGADCAPYDKLYRVLRRDIAALDAGEEPSLEVVQWPWHLGAPVVDGDGNPDNYDLAAGDRPLLLGDENVWWVMNDIGNAHVTSGTDPLGLEVRGMAFSSASTENPWFDTSVFYAYEIINKNTVPIKEMYLGLVMDSDLGNFDDDFVGSDSLLNLAYTYNADNIDDDFYGENPPAVGFQVIKAPDLERPDDRKMTSMIFINYGGGPTGDPQSGSEYYALSKGLWKNGEVVTTGESGYRSAGEPTTYMFSGAAEDAAFWSENNVDGDGLANKMGDRRGIMGMGPFTLAPGERTTLILADITAFGSDHLDSIVRLKEAALSFQDLTPEAVPPSPVAGSAPSTAPSVVSVADGATGQPVDLELAWAWPGSKEVEFEVQLARGTDVDPASEATRSWLLSEQRLNPGAVIDRRFVPGLEPDAVYTARIRAATAAGYGPWSDTVTFSTGDVLFEVGDVFTGFEVVANAAGPLAEPVGAAADFQGFPGAPPNADQQVGEGQWMIHTFENGTAITFDDFLDRTVWGRPNGARHIVPFDFEIRFTPEGGKAWNFVTDQSVVNVPFELWRIGTGTPGDTSDDVRLIPWIIDWERDGWGLRCVDHSLQSTANDPETDAIYWHLPSDETPGDSGYRAWADEVTATGRGDGNAWQAEIMGRMVLVNFNGGDIADCQFNQALPEVGTVFRITTQRLPAPIPGAPANESVVSAGPVSFYWMAASSRASRLEVARDAAFSQLLLVLEDVESGRAQMSALEAGTYWWRVTDAVGTSSEPVRFFVGTSVSTDDVSDGALPARFALGAAYPNPFSLQTTITFDLPEAAHVRLRIYDVLGRELRTLVNTAAPPGRHEATFRADALPGGTYFYVLEAGDFRDTGQVVVVR